MSRRVLYIVAAIVVVAALAAVVRQVDLIHLLKRMHGMA